MEGTPRAGAVLVGKYRVDSVLGREGLCIVLRVTHLRVAGQPVFKMILPEATASLAVHARFLKEAQATAHLCGEHVARIIDVGLFPSGAPYLVMEHLHGGDLAGELARRGALGTAEAVDTLLQCCDALAEAHAHGIVHRDIKPANIGLIARADGPAMVKLLDLGISKMLAAVDNPLARTDSVMGTPGYMAPEQYRLGDELDARTDIWALGAVLYECLTGARAFPGAARGGPAHAPRPMDFRIPEALQASVSRCLDADREARYPTIAALAAALAPFAHDPHAAAVVVERAKLWSQGINPGLEPPPQYAMTSGPVADPVRRRRYMTIGAVALAVSLCGIATAALIRPGRTHGSAPAPKAAVASGAAPAAARPSGTAASGSATTAVPVGPPSASPPSASPPSANPPSANPPSAAAASANPPSAAVASANSPSAGPPSAASTPAAKLPPAAAPPAPTTTAAARPNEATPAEASAIRPAPAGAPRGDSEAAQKLAHCGDLQSQKQWQALDDCATELARLGSDDRAEKLHTTARQERQNERLHDKLRQALRDGDLQEAQAALQLIGAGSVYLGPARDSFTTAERDRADEARRKAQSLAASHDCAGIKRYIAELGSSATDRVLAAARTVSCDEQLAPDERPDKADRDKPDKADRDKPDKADRDKPDKPDRDKPDKADRDKPDRDKPDKADRDKPDRDKPDRAARPASPPGPALTAKQRKEACDSVDVSDLMTRAATQYAAGAPGAALSLARIALGCKQTDRMYWLATMYACAAHDAAAARQYFPRVPSNLQPGIEQKCQQDNLDPRSR